MRAVDYLSLMREKGVSFRVVQHGLKFNNLSSAKGWEPLLEHYDEVDDEHINNVLKDLYISQLFHGQRTVYFSEINGDNPKKIAENIERVSQVISSIYYTAIHKSINIYRGNYPLPIDEADLYKAPLNNPCPVFIEQSGDNIRLVMTYPRAYKERVIVDVGDIELSDSDVSHFSDYDEIIGIKSGRAQSFDCIQVNKNTGVIQFQIDHSKNILKDDMDKAVIRYRHMLMDGYRDMFGGTIPWNKVNIHTKIDELYNSDDGRIHNLEHATVTGSVKTEKMRKRVDDLRDESFHLAGLDAIDGDTTNFCITKQWDGECGSSLKLTIDGGVTLAARSNPEIDCATLEGCITEYDFNLLISKVL